MSESHLHSSGSFTPGNKKSHSFSLPIPPPPLPPMLPPPSSSSSTIPPPPVPQTFYNTQFSDNIFLQPNIVPPPAPPIFRPSTTIPPAPVPQAFLPIQLPRSSSAFPNQSFHSGDCSVYSAAPPWSISHVSPDQIHQKTLAKETVVKSSFNKTHSQDFLDNWLRNKKISQVIHKEPAEKSVKIYVMKEKLNAAFRLIKELENGARTLSVMVKTVTGPEWEQKCNEIEGKKKELTALLNQLKLSREEVAAVNEKCLKRSKKRARLRRQAERWKKQKEEDKIRSQNREIQIDNWQKEMQEGVERIQREKELQREADAVLWGVTQKKSEARRQVALMSALLELRKVRVQRLTAAGKPVSSTQIDTFNTVIERLKKMWTKHLDECLLEEQVLRGMLSEAEIKDDPVKTYKKLVLQEWETALFGSVGTLDSTPRGEKLINTRHDWDQFIVQEHTVLASTIPPGWVLPVAPSSDQWRTLLKY